MTEGRLPFGPGHPLAHLRPGHRQPAYDAWVVPTRRVTDEFFRHWEEKGRRRTVVTAKAGETIEVIGRRFGVTSSLMERINRRGRSEPLAPGERVVVWVPGNGAATSANAQATLTRPSSIVLPEPTPPLGAPPSPELLPVLP